MSAFRSAEIVRYYSSRDKAFDNQAVHVRHAILKMIAHKFILAKQTGCFEAVSEYQIWFFIKAGEDFNHRNTLSILRIKI